MPALETLRRREAGLEAAWRTLERDAQGYSGVLALLADPALSKQERDERVRAADRAQRAFLDRLDGFLRRLHAHFLEQVVRELDRAMATMAAFYGAGRLGAVARRHRRLLGLADRYRELEPLYGSARDHRRIAVYQRFYARVVAFSRWIRRLDPTAPRPHPRSPLDRLYALRRGLMRLATRTPAALRLSLAAVRLLAALLSRRPAERGTPFTNRVDALFRAWGEVRGLRVEVSGIERVVAEPPPGAVRLFAPAHRHGVTDNVTFSHLGLPDYLVFNAVDQLPGVPAFLKERIAATPGLVPVGGGRGPAVDRALDAVRRDVSRNLLVYPEGSVSEGFRGTRPPRRNFGEGLVRRLRASGVALSVFPVTYLDNARFLDLPPVSRSPEERRLRVVVGPPLGPAALDALLEAGGGEMVNRMVRLAWLETLVTDDAHFLGQDRVTAIETRLADELDGIRYWGSLESAPVSDFLETDAREPIRVREEPFHGKRLRVLRIPESARDAEGRIPLRNLRDPDSLELLLGIRPPSHVYLSVGPRRFDGDIFRRLSVKERDTIPPGIVIRFVGVPIKSLHAIRRELERTGGREQRTLTCANSACQLIARAANIEIDDPADMRPFLPSHVLPTRTIRQLIERGVRNHRGDPVEIQIYKTDARSLEEILAEARREEVRITREHLEILSVGAARATWRRLRRLASRLVRAFHR